MTAPGMTPGTRAVIHITGIKLYCDCGREGDIDEAAVDVHCACGNVYKLPRAMRLVPHHRFNP